MSASTVTTKPIAIHHHHVTPPHKKRPICQHVHTHRTSARQALPCSPSPSPLPSSPPSPSPPPSRPLLPLPRPAASYTSAHPVGEDAGGECARGEAKPPRFSQHLCPRPADPVRSKAEQRAAPRTQCDTAQEYSAEKHSTAAQRRVRGTQRRPRD
eukprot:1127148-Rhodomonas_salina.1